jgi:hypothetical protein
VAACRAALRSHRCPAPCRAVPSRSAARCCIAIYAAATRGAGWRRWMFVMARLGAARQLRKLGPAHAVIASATELIPESVARNGVPTIAQARLPMGRWSRWLQRQCCVHGGVCNVGAVRRHGVLRCGAATHCMRSIQCAGRSCAAAYRRSQALIFQTPDRRSRLGTGNRRSGTGNRRSGTDNRRSGTGNRRSGTTQSP